MTGHTPEVETGGWQVERSDGEWGTYRLDGFVEPDYADEADLERAHDQETADVNLIAAAPRMYRVLVDLCAAGWGSGRPPQSVFDDAHDVLQWIDQA